jgi:hypothetical protein
VLSFSCKEIRKPKNLQVSSSKLIMSLPPWHMLRTKPKPAETTDMGSNVTWVCPPLLQLEKHARFYRDLTRSTEKVELTLSHSGKSEVFSGLDSPSEPSVVHSSKHIKHDVILVPIRGDTDPRWEWKTPDGNLKTPKIYCDKDDLRGILLRRCQYATPMDSRHGTPIGSPVNKPSPSPMSNTSYPRPPPPPGGPGQKPPPPPPPKKPRVDAGDWINQ